MIKKTVMHALHPASIYLQVLAHFSRTVRDDVDTQALTSEIHRVIQEAMQPERVSLWLSPK